MSILRTDKQVAFNDLLMAVDEAMGGYEDFAEILDDRPIADMFRSFTQERKAIAGQLEAAIRQQDDLPSHPDADREDLGKLVHRIRALLSENEILKALQEMIEDEERTLELAQICEQQGLMPTEEAVVAQLVADVERALTRMRTMAVKFAP